MSEEIEIVGEEQNESIYEKLVFNMTNGCKVILKESRVIKYKMVLRVAF